VSATLSPIQQKAQTSLALGLSPLQFLLPFLEQPASFQCGLPTSFRGTLTFPQSLGLSNRVLSVSSVAADGSVRFVGSTATGTLVPSATQLGTATGDASFVVPFNATNLTASFSGDTFLQASTSPFFRVAVQPIPMTVQFVGLPSTATNPLTISVRVSNNAVSGCNITGPEGTVEFFDGTTSLGVVSLPANQVSATQILDGTSNTIQFGEVGKQVNLVVARPVGVHNLKARYNGDKFHAITESPVVAVTFQ
jgi:hypothetical protein